MKLWQVFICLGLEAICEGEQQEQPIEIDQASTTTAPLPPNSGFSRAQTLFLIDLMRQHLEGDCRGLPKTLAELNARVKAAKGKKKTPLDGHSCQAILPV